jgi:hypothetical protein
VGLKHQSLALPERSLMFLVLLNVIPVQTRIINSTLGSPLVRLDAKMVSIASAVLIWQDLMMGSKDKYASWDISASKAQ